MDHALFVQAVRHAGIFVKFRPLSGYVQANPGCIFAPPYGFEEGRLVLLYRRSPYINQIQWPVLVEIVVRRRFGAKATVGNDAVGERETISLHIMPNQPLAYVLRRTLQELIFSGCTWYVPVMGLPNFLAQFIAA